MAEKPKQAKQAARDQAEAKAPDSSSDAGFEKGWKKGYAQGTADVNERLQRCNQKGCAKPFITGQSVFVADAHLFCSHFCYLLGA
jgi:flagellar biosynthesis/type III secretory pathway protein FliH